MSKALKVLHDIQQRIHVAKNKRNTFAEFNYRSAEDIMAALKPLLAEHKAVMKVDDSVEQIGSTDRFSIQATVTLYAEDGSTVSGYGEAVHPLKELPKMSMPQTSGSTSSYARKYALQGLLLLDDNQDPDTGKMKPVFDEEHPLWENAVTKAKSGKIDMKSLKKTFEVSPEIEAKLTSLL